MNMRDIVPWNLGVRRVPVRRERTPATSLQREINTLFDSFLNDPFFSGTAVTLPKAAAQFSPAIDVTENEQAILVSVELPGLEENEVDLSLTQDQLTISGEKKSEHERTENGATYFESSFGSFKRVIPIHVEIDPDTVEAKMKNGVLKITLPKAEDSSRGPRKISVKSH